jgi:hypothetical protein
MQSFCPKEHEVHEAEIFSSAMLSQLSFWSMVQIDCSTYCFVILRVLRALRGNFFRLDFISGLKRYAP